MTYSEVWDAHGVGLQYISSPHHLISCCAGAPIQHLKAFWHLEVSQECSTAWLLVTAASALAQLLYGNRSSGELEHLD